MFCLAAVCFDDEPGACPNLGVCIKPDECQCGPGYAPPRCVGKARWMGFGRLLWLFKPFSRVSYVLVGFVNIRRLREGTSVVDYLMYQVKAMLNAPRRLSLRTPILNVITSPNFEPF